jgi:peptidoglycan/LPS O-acetylase OafA/YrhL
MVCPVHPKHRYYPQLDGLRALAVLIVVGGHELLDTPAHEVAALGVLLFFVLSGFLITTLLCDEDRDTGRVDLGAFYLRRAMRILPAMYALLAVTALLVAIRRVTDVPWRDFAAAVLYVRNLFGRGTSIAHLWSLSIEEQFYLVWPLLIIMVPSGARLVTAAALVLAGVTWRATAMTLHLFDYNGIYYMRTDFRLDSILSGCVLALLLRSDDVRVIKWARIVAKVSYPPALLAVLFALILVPLPSSCAPYVLTAETSLATMLLLHLIVLDSDIFGRILSTRTLRWLGRLSYSWYLWQQVFIVTRVPSWGIVRKFPVDILASFAAALTSYYAVERPFLRWKRALSSGRSQRQREGHSAKIASAVPGL